MAVQGDVHAQQTQYRERLRCQPKTIYCFSHITKTRERLILDQLGPMVRPHLDPLQFAYQPQLRIPSSTCWTVSTSTWFALTKHTWKLNTPLTRTTIGWGRAFLRGVCMISLYLSGFHPRTLEANSKRIPLTLDNFVNPFGRFPQGNWSSMSH